MIPMLAVDICNCV